MGKFKKRAFIIRTLCELKRSITFDECNRCKTYFDGVRHGLKLAIRALEHMPKEWFVDDNNL